MKRLHRNETCWHVMMRGARRLLLFRDDADRSAFLRILGQSIEDKGVTLHAWVLMDNHYHLLAGAEGSALSACMQVLNRRFSRGNNEKYGLQGHLFEGPYLAFPQRSGFWMARSSRYIDFNPVKAGMVRKPEDYRWSSCRSVVRGEAGPVKIDPKPVLDAIGGREAYRAFVPPASRRKPSRHPSAGDVWAEHVAWLEALAQEREKDLGGESPKTLAAAWARQSGVPPRAIAEALGYADGHSVSVLLDSIRKRAERDPALRKLLEMVK